MMEQDFIKAVANSGPWAIAFAYAFSLITKAWMQDRQRLDVVLEKIQPTFSQIGQALTELKDSIRALTEEQKSLRDALEELRRGPR